MLYRLYNLRKWCTALSVSARRADFLFCPFSIFHLKGNKGLQFFYDLPALAIHSNYHFREVTKMILLAQFTDVGKLVVSWNICHKGKRYVEQFQGQIQG